MPYEELELLRNAIDAAVVEAGCGSCDEGYSELSYGLRRAEMMQRDGLPWARDLAASYTDAIQAYCARYRLTAG
jgi:hypothetical protein